MTVSPRIITSDQKTRAGELETSLAQKHRARMSAHLRGSFRQERGKAGIFPAPELWICVWGLLLVRWHGRALFHQGFGESFCWGHKRARWSGTVW